MTTGFCAASNRAPTGAPPAADDRIGVIIDLETTGLDHTKDEPIELGMVKFAYSASGELTGAVDVFQAFRQPAIAIPADVTTITGITDEITASPAPAFRICSPMPGYSTTPIAPSTTAMLSSKSWRGRSEKAGRLV